jgi:tripeptide aminopeptidase
MINKDRVVESFLELVSVNGESGNEQQISNYIQKKLNHLGISYSIDNAGDSFGGNAGNITAQIPGANIPGIVFSSHMDSIEPTEGIKTKIEDGKIKTDGKTILAADDRAGIAIILEVLQTVKENDLEHPPLTIIFTVAEEIGMYGSKNISIKELNASCGFVFDSSADPGNLIQIAPSKIQLKIKVIGKASHAAVSPEKGINAITIACNSLSKIKTGKFDDGSTLNFGSIKGGKAINIIPGLVEIDAELRGFDNEYLTSKIDEIKQVFINEAEKLGGSIRIDIDEKYRAFALDEESAPIKIVKNAIEKTDLSPKLLKYSGGSDANVFNANGLPSVNLGMGFKNCHSVNEFILVDDLTKSCEIAFNIIGSAYNYFNKNF